MRNVAVANNIMGLNSMKSIWKPVYVETQHFIVFNIRPIGIWYEYFKTEFFRCVIVFPFFSFWLFWLLVVVVFFFFSPVRAEPVRIFLLFRLCFANFYSRETLFFKIPNLINLKSPGIWATFKSTEVGPFYLKHVKLYKVICSQNRYSMILIFTAVPTTFCTPPSTYHQCLNSPGEVVFWLLCQPVMHRLLYLLIRSEVTCT